MFSFQRHCEEARRADEAIQSGWLLSVRPLDCFASLAMTGWGEAV